MRAWIQLGLAIGVEIIGTSLLKLSAGFSHLWIGMIGMVLYGLAIFSFSMALRRIPLSVGYAIWAGGGTAITSLIGVWAFGEILSGPKLVGLIAVIIGVVLLNLPVKASSPRPVRRWRSRTSRD
ncbi:DMT family transporter [Lactiplantibacillus mudanjiangensis]|uniref:QacE family quaternary ammonium compound efflux SMR transporter [Lactobacillus sp.] n=1 Tax=Lactiplantibacillus mudanjiangensis TaxID=1296538 RepID=A0A660DVW1_9LACO|nr:multidrug efflux SMR transporter [Lactiplantibacillus mudanjiangensis]VDG20369.1 QacE family quaternary ammonium compound efflux SMR transporter [Lactobacillus sp.] [Lactiplantibacillus mudanjiangensis]VDG23935.1 QacE family quaternary ammonium compound efflux SMR transporter [Lactobacillus sp.] [Lactiplantibacillus mudanjiangensis]VDG27111.1 QacE family quaternary ammonium compound efflux SMR transporter [Lactobacillus sp.] [Lactiplantibacillus mudanjiangensis]VDG33982.1 QacE family quatern